MRPKNTLHSVAGATVLILLFLCLTRQNRISWQFSKSRARQTYPILFAKGQSLAIPVDLVCQNVFRIRSIALPIPGHRPPEVFRLIERLEVQPFDPGVAVHQTDVQFWTKLSVGMGLPTNDGSNPGLCRTNDVPGDAVSSRLKHDPLLLINSGDCIQAFGPSRTVLRHFELINDIASRRMHYSCLRTTERIAFALHFLLLDRWR